ncbi:phosphatidylglycerophosphatase A [Candidatus Dependentiae bacterium HGW-Dependentiae-1]|nr:MAG: phosphatidylglycerophosphatase A [Candidatus Dependentiae bacterium HGW-Dependentiae-1]
MSKFFKFLATLGPIGYAPASGTVATLVAAPLVWAMEDLSFDDYLLVSGVLLLTSFWIIQRALGAFASKNHDPSEVVLDEVVGFVCLFIIIPITPLSIALAFILFRFFDIVKPFGIKRCENLVGSIGIVVDDLLAAFFAGGILALSIMLLERF